MTRSRSVAATTDLRPLAIGEILDRALKIVWRNAKTLAAVVVFVILPIQIVSTLVTVSAAPDRLNTSPFATQTTTTTANINFGAYAAAAIIAGILGWLGSTLASGACFRAIASAYLGESTDARGSLSFAFHRLPSILWVSLLAGLAAFGGAILCIIPGIYWGVAFSLGVPVLMSEGRKGTEALGRSRALVKGFWWRVFAVVALGYLLSGILGTLISGLVLGLTSISAGSTSIAAIVVSIIGGTVSKLVTTPFVAAFITVLYFDLRVRKEGFDLQLLAERLGVEPPPGAFAAARQAELPASSEQPPFWPPPPGWKPGAKDP